MTKMSKYPHGVFSWVDLVAHDLDAAKRWYAELFGWEAKDQDTQGGPPYVMFLQDGVPVAGAGQMSDEMKGMGAPAMWNDYVTVEDIEAVAAKVSELGGEVMVPVMKVLDAGQLAFFKDPTGASFAIWQAGNHHGAGLVNEPNSLAWNELATPDVEAAKRFYKELLGWSYEAMDMGSFEYTLIKVGGRDNGGMMPMTGPEWEGIPPHWVSYFAVADCDATAKKLVDSGGTIKFEPMDTPPGRIAFVADPQGATFAIITLNERPS